MAHQLNFLSKSCLLPGNIVAKELQAIL